MRFHCVYLIPAVAEIVLDMLRVLSVLIHIKLVSAGMILLIGPLSRCLFSNSSLKPKMIKSENGESKLYLPHTSIQGYLSTEVTLKCFKHGHVFIVILLSLLAHRIIVASHS